MSSFGHRAFATWAVLIATFFTARALLAAPGQVDGLLGEPTALWLGGASKLLAFTLATAYAWRVAAAFGRDNPAWRSWVSLAVGFVGFGVGQAVLVTHQLAIPGPTPFPSAADPAFLLGYVALIAAFIGFARTFTGSGLAVGTTANPRRTAFVSALVLVVVAGLALTPTFSADAPVAERVVGAAYPALDCVLLVPTIVLTRITVALRQGQLAGPWIRLLLGFFAFTIGDVLFALVETLDLGGVDAILDLFFALGYLLAAWGCYAQDRLARSH